jgi:hypothetical protein
MDVLAAAGRSCPVTLDIHTVDALSRRPGKPLPSGPKDETCGLHRKDQRQHHAAALLAGKLGHQSL